ncbi:hypothetical protein [Mesorhizobium sp. WSM2239]|uniref:Uncharacterized protein n=2 Tax=unclassified Mesorhizobium TaxID=325217 RepID=A0AAU8DJU0_9HYPH
MSTRYYLFQEEGEPQRLSRRLVEGLISGKDSLPKYAGTSQLVLSAMLELEAGLPNEQHGMWKRVSVFMSAAAKSHHSSIQCFNRRAHIIQLTWGYPRGRAKGQRH